MLSTQQRAILHETAFHSIEHGLKDDSALTVTLPNYESCLQEKSATFVTLNCDGMLRGCIGILIPIRALVEDVAHNAYAAAFDDHRFE